MADVSARAIVRIVLIIVAVLLGLYLLYLLRRPIGWVLIAAFIAIALSGPVNWLDKRIRRGFAILIVYVGLLMVPLFIAALVVPPMVQGAEDLAQNAPRYAKDVSEFVSGNERLRELNEDYDITTKLEEEAAKLPGKLGGAAGTLRDVGIGVVNSVFALVTILILTAFMLGSGRHWVNAFLARVPRDRREPLRRVLEHAANAVGAYVGGVLIQATIAGVTTYIVLTILGVPFRAPLSVLVFFFDLIPLIGATIAAVVVGVITLFTDFPTATIIWTIWAIAYQQVENSVIQPQIQKRAIDVHPFVVLVAVLFGSTLLGIVGALVAIPVAATLQIAAREYSRFRRDAQQMAAQPDTPMTKEPPPAPA